MNDQSRMEKIFATMPEIPDDFEAWCLKMLRVTPIYYKRNGKTADCRCGRCDNGYSVVGKPVRGEITKCKVCGSSGRYEWAKVTRTEHQKESAYLFQCTSDKGIVVRIFEVYQIVQQYTYVTESVTEVERIFIQPYEVIYFNCDHRYVEGRWKNVWNKGKSKSEKFIGEAYPTYQTEISKSVLKYCRIQDLLNASGIVNRGYWLSGIGIKDVLIAFAQNPAIEMYAKMGMSKLTYHLLRKGGVTKEIYRKGKTPKKQLRLKNKQNINRLIEKKGDISWLRLLQMEEKKGWKLQKNEEDFALRLIDIGEGEQWLKFFKQFMSVQQLMNRIDKWMKDEKWKDFQRNSMIRRYYDYLQMRQELGYDMTNQVYLNPKNLKQKHDQMVKEREAKRDVLHIEKKNKEFTQIPKRYPTLSKRYEYSEDGYVIRPASSAGEIIAEGRTLHHCVGGDNYLRKHDTGKSFILFLRKEESNDVPYYTIEIKGDEIIQWYGIKDTKPDREVIEPWLNRYVEHLKGLNEKTVEKMMIAAG